MPLFLPLPSGIMQLLERYKVPTSGKHCVVVGRSHIVGRPISILMSQKGPREMLLLLLHIAEQKI